MGSSSGNYPAILGLIDGSTTNANFGASGVVLTPSLSE